MPYSTYIDVDNSLIINKHEQEAHLRWTRDRSRVNWEEFVRYQVRANETYSKAKCQFVIETGMFL